MSASRGKAVVFGKARIGLQIAKNRHWRIAKRKRNECEFLHAKARSVACICVPLFISWN